MYSDGDGWQNIEAAYLPISTSVNIVNCFLGYYDQNTNKLYLRDDENTAWLGGDAPGSNYTIENSYAKLDCLNTQVSGTGAVMTIKWSVIFKKPFTGTKNTYLYAKDDMGGYAAWAKKGTWAILNNTPQVGTVTPQNGSSVVNQVTTITASYTDIDTWLNLQSVYIRVDTQVNGTICLYAYYDQNTNKLYLRNDTKNGWLGGYAPGASNVIENTYCKLYCQATSVSGSENTLTVNWSVAFKPVFTGSKNVYLYVNDDTGAYQGWVQKGAWVIESSDTTSPTGAVKINNDAQYANTVSVTLNLTASDIGSGVSQMQFSNDGTAWTSAESYAVTKSWPLISGDGSKTVFVKYKDGAGNWSTAYRDTIQLDTTAPSGSILINNGNSYTNLRDAELNLQAIDTGSGVSQMQFSSDGSSWSSAETYTTSKTWTLTEGDGQKTVYVKYKDQAGNSSGGYSDSITLDTIAPEIVITSPKDGAAVDTAGITLTGTIDGASFSEERILQNEGENIVSKTAVDSVGNSSSASIKVYYYSGAQIGPGGGEVYSPDGKMKVIIPEGALSEPKSIRILPISLDTLDNTAPQGKTLLSVVECRPYGLVFNKPVLLIYTLYQAEIPGAIVELGLYDRAQNKIIPTGQSSSVEKDGYTLSFSLMHFSTYAALKSTAQDTTPINASVQIPLPDMLTGAFSHAIPISIPPGRKGIQPSIALVYHSSNGNSWVGLGFNLNSGYIVRSTRIGPPKYTDDDTFYFISDSGTTELVRLIDNLYQAKIESSFAKFFKEGDDSWRVVNKDGSVLLFGKDSSAKETSNQGTFSWYLTKVIDTNGNYIEYEYIKDGGKCYSSKIEWTGNDKGVSPRNSVEFILEGRSDIMSSYISSARIATVKRLKEIDVKVDTELVWRYILEYEYSEDTNRSLLRSVIQYGADGKAMPEQKLGYQ